MRSPRWFRVAVALCLATILAMVGCANPSAPTPVPGVRTSAPISVPTSSATPKSIPAGPYGELKVAVASFASQIVDLPQAVTTARFGLLGEIFDTILRASGGKLAPGLAEKWEVAPNGLAWVFYIRKGVKFQDGTALTAKDVKFSIDKISAEDRYDVDLRNSITTVELVDDYTVRVNTKAPRPYLPSYVGVFPPGQGFVMSKDYYDKSGTEYAGTHPMGSGPYKLSRSVPGDSVEYSVNTQYWRRVPDFAKLTMILIPEQSTRVAMMKTGATNVTETTLDGAVELEKAGFTSTVQTTFLNGVVLLGALQPEAAGMPIADIRVRKALSLAINRDEINSSFFFGKGQYQAPAYMGEVNADDVDLPYWIDYNKQLNPYDPVKAKQLLAEAGYANGFSIKISSFTMAGRAFLPQLAQIVGGYWEKIGVRTQFVVGEQITMQPFINTLKYPSGPGSMVGQTFVWAIQANPTLRNLQNNYSASPDTRLALLGKAFPEVPKLQNQAEGETNAAKRKELVAQILRIAADAYTLLPLVAAPTMFSTSPDVELVRPFDTSNLGMIVDAAKHRQK